MTQMQPVKKFLKKISAGIFTRQNFIWKPKKTVNKYRYIGFISVGF